MTALIDSLTQVIDAHPLMTYAVVFGLAVVEAVPVVGTFVPGSTAIFLISALVPTGVLDTWMLLGAAIPGAILGDAFSYWLGHRYQSELANVWPFRRFPYLIERGESFFRRHGGKSVFLARFTPPIRGIVPLVAGLAGMPAIRFYAANVASAVPWALLHVLPGVLLGASLTLAGDGASHVAILLGILVLAFWLIYRASRYLLAATPRLAETARERLVGWARRRPAGLARYVLGLVEPQQSAVGALALLGAVLVGSLWLFFGILEDVIAGDPIVQLDVSVFQFLQDVRIAPLDRVMVAITELGSGVVIAAALLASLAWLSYRRAWSTALYVLAAVGLAQVFTIALKLGLQRARPNETLYAGWSAFSFPSGHATMSAAAYGFLAYLVAREFRGMGRWAVMGGVSGLVLLIGFSRLYLGAHWLSDIAGGWTLSAAWIAILAMGYEHHRPPAIRAGGLIAVVLAATVATAGIALPRDYSADLNKYARRQTTQLIAAADWWNDGWERLPAWRTDPRGEREEPFTVQWAGDLRELVDTLSRRGWREAPNWNSIGLLAWLMPDSDSTTLPALPKLDRGRLPVIELVNDDADPGCPRCRLVLRLWSSGYLATAGVERYPISTGGIVREHLRSFWFLTLASDTPRLARPISGVLSDMNQGRVARRAEGQADIGWDGSVLLSGEPRIVPPR